MNRRNLRKALFAAIWESDLDLREKLRLRLFLSVPFFQEATLEYIEKALGDTISTMSVEDIIKFIIENLPAILEFIEGLIKLFG